MKNINLQRVTVDDVEKFLFLEKSVVGAKTYNGTVEKDEAKEEIEENIIYFIKMDDLVVGNIEYSIEADGTAYLGGLVVLPDFQGQGIARQAMESVFKEIGDVKRIYLFTHPHNIPAIRLYLSFGFIIEGWKDNHFGDGEPRIIMSRLKK